MSRQLLAIIEEAIDAVLERKSAERWLRKEEDRIRRRDSVKCGFAIGTTLYQCTTEDGFFEATIEGDRVINILGTLHWFTPDHAKVWRPTKEAAVEAWIESCEDNVTAKEIAEAEKELEMQSKWSEWAEMRLEALQRRRN